jgi:hypothetical protein
LQIHVPEDSGKYWLYQYCRYWKILENTDNTSIADTGKYWLYQYCRYWKIRYEVAECTCILVFCPVCASVMRRRTVYRETGRKEKRGRKVALEIC